MFSASLGRLQLDTEPYESPLPSQRSTLRRDSHILAEISEMDSTFTNQESVSKLLNAQKRFLYSYNIKEEKEMDVDDILATINDLVEEMENDGNGDSVHEFRETTPVLGHANDDERMIDELFNFDQDNEAITIAPVHETPSSRLFTCGLQC